MTIVSGSKFFKKMDFKIIKPSHITEIKETDFEELVRFAQVPIT